MNGRSARSRMVELIRALINTNATSSNATIGQAPHFSLRKSLGNQKHSVKNSAPSRNLA
jgi:hypothetical protein